MSIENIVLRVNSQIDAQIRAVTIGLFSSIIKMTPVDTGRAKGNWQCTINSGATNVVTRDDNSPYGSANGETMDMLLTTIPPRAGHKVFLSNNLPYIERLEYGYSKQAPSGMVRVSVQRFSGLMS
jgi:hypothetical protein